MLTVEMFREAVKSHGNECEEKGCIHAAVLDMNDVMRAITEAKGRAALLHDFDGSLSVFGWGMHIGYRLRQLEESADFATAMNAAQEKA